MLRHGRVQKLTLSYQRHGPDEGVTYPGQTYAASLLVACSASLQQLKWKLQFPGPGPGSKILLGLLANMHQLCVLHVHLDSCYLKEIVLAGQHVEEVSLHGGSHSDCVALQRQSAEDDDPICDSDALVASIAPQRIEAATGLPQLRILRLLGCELKRESAWHIDEHARVDLIKGIREPWSSRLPQYLAQMLHLEQRTVSVKPCHIGSSVLGDDLGSRFPQLQRLEVHLDTRSAWPDWWEEFGEEHALYEASMGLCFELIQQRSQRLIVKAAELQIPQRTTWPKIVSAADIPLVETVLERLGFTCSLLSIAGSRADSHYTLEVISRRRYIFQRAGFQKAQPPVLHVKWSALTNAQYHTLCRAELPTVKVEFNPRDSRIKEVLTHPTFLELAVGHIEELEGITPDGDWLVKVAGRYLKLHKICLAARSSSDWEGSVRLAEKLAAGQGQVHKLTLLRRKVTGAPVNSGSEYTCFAIKMLWTCAPWLQLLKMTVVAPAPKHLAALFSYMPQLRVVDLKVDSSGAWDVVQACAHVEQGVLELPHHGEAAEMRKEWAACHGSFELCDNYDGGEIWARLGLSSIRHGRLRELAFRVDNSLATNSLEELNVPQFEISVDCPELCVFRDQASSLLEVQQQSAAMWRRLKALCPRLRSVVVLTDPPPQGEGTKYAFPALRGLLSLEPQIHVDWTE
ncbi:hypothetical protein WJX72_001437 [[Myrmecia] bisecta]|uniref:Uncharacterized protein n=1 Tax=[Myrmecia] bisecta TaxID=41462 RepID=A0AAW1P3T1_9CHLO